MDYADDVINNMEDCEQPEWTIFSETVKEKGTDHCGVTTVGKSMQKRETWWWSKTVQETGKRECSRSGNNRKHEKIMLLTKKPKREAKRTVAVERSNAAPQ